MKSTWLFVSYDDIDALFVQNLLEIKLFAMWSLPAARLQTIPVFIWRAYYIVMIMLLIFAL